MDAEISRIVLGWLNPSVNQSISRLKRAGSSLRHISFAGVISVYMYLQTKAFDSNSCYCSCAREQSLFCLQLHADEAYGSMQWKMTHYPRLFVKTADNCNNSYCVSNHIILFADFLLKAKKKQALQLLGTNFLIECFD